LRNQACPDGGIGRRAGLKHQWIHFHPGSTPGLGTEAEKVEKLSPLFFSTPRNLLIWDQVEMLWDQRKNSVKLLALLLSVYLRV
jgi:hypothetical protein